MTDRKKEIQTDKKKQTKTEMEILEELDCEKTASRRKWKNGRINRIRERQIKSLARTK